MGSSIIGLVASLVVGTAVASATVIGVVSSQTSAPEESPASVESPVIDYGSN